MFSFTYVDYGIVLIFTAFVSNFFVAKYRKYFTLQINPIFRSENLRAGQIWQKVCLHLGSLVFKMKESVISCSLKRRRYLSFGENFVDSLLSFDRLYIIKHR